MDLADPNPPQGSADGQLSPNASGSAASKTRKRTKTGCLTCRKRRIKCGEERPTCANCIKSKRQCEGYNQRVVFKPPIGDWPNHPGVVSTLQYHNSMLPGTRSATYRTNQPSSQPPESPLTSIQPRPLTHFEYSSENTPTLGHLNTQQTYSSNAQPYGQDVSYSQPLPSPQHRQPLHSPQHQIPTPTSATSYFSQPSPVQASFQGSQYAHEGPRYTQNQYQVSAPPDDQSYYGYGSHSQLPLQQPQVTSAAFSQAEAYALSVSHADSSHSSFSSVQIPQHDVPSPVKYMHQHPVYEPPAPTARLPKVTAQIQSSGFGGEDHASPTQVLDEAAVEEVDDEYWDVDSDEEMADAHVDNNDDSLIMSKDFSLIRRIHFENSNMLSIRRYDAFIYEGILSHYVAEQAANPLKNPRTARVFAHFIHVTGPSLSIYERNPRNPTSIFEGPTPPSQQSLWTYILPLKALNHQGLLHSMLALASLHIARLQRASVTPSYKHYAYALKRLSRSLANPKKRNSVATLATSLLLAFYEVMTAEHVKWSTHLVGATQLISELDYPSLSREARRLKAVQNAEERNMLSPRKLSPNVGDKNNKEDTLAPDEDVISSIVGKKVSYDEFGSVVEIIDDQQQKPQRDAPKLDLRTFETLQDLYWYHSRHDAFQSMVSGNPLVKPFRKWTDCPPRAPLGRADAIYGTHDHVVLLIGRISDFTVRDRTRKLKQVEANGGQWIPTPDMPGGMPKGPPPPARKSKGEPPNPSRPVGPPLHLQGLGPSLSGAPPGQGAGQGPRAGPGMPPFFGMAPAQPPIPLPTSYASPIGRDPSASPKSPTSPHPSLADLPVAYASAVEEWNDISRAHVVIANALAASEAFSPLTPDLYPVAPGGNMTPFGPALVHRSYDISTLWTLLHLSKILLIRSHPAMPPAATVAAVVAAETTKPYATLIGRISAGMQVPASDALPLSPFLGAALIETTMALFFAGVQYQDNSQRMWLIKRLLDIDRRTGWASAASIARSCETAWERAAEAGRGPPYEARKTRRYNEEGPIVLDGEGGDGRDGGSVSRDGKGGWGGTGVLKVARAEGEEWGFVVGLRVPWAKNLLATEEELRADMEKVDLGGGEGGAE